MSMTQSMSAPAPNSSPPPPLLSNLGHSGLPAALLQPPQSAHHPKSQLHLPAPSPATETSRGFSLRPSPATNSSLTCRAPVTVPSHHVASASWLLAALSLSSRATTGTVLSWTPMYHHVSFSCLSGFPSKISSVTLASSLRPKALPNVGTAESPREPAEWKPGLISPGSKGSYQLSCVPAPEFVSSSLYPGMVECDCTGGWGL